MALIIDCAECGDVLEHSTDPLRRLADALNELRDVGAEVDMSDETDRPRVTCAACVGSPVTTAE